MRPRLRKWLVRTAIGLVGLIALIVALVAIVLHTDWGQRQIREQAEKALAGTFAGEVDIGDMDVGLFGSVKLSNLTIKYPNGELALSIDRLSIECSVLPLLAARVRCGTLSVETPQFWHRPDAGALLRPNDEEPKANVKIAKIAVRGGRVEIPGEVFSAIEAELADLAVRGPDVAVGIKALSARIGSQDRAVTVEGAVALADNVVTLSGGAVASGDSVLVLELEKLDLESGELRASVGGEVVAADVPVEGWRSKVAPNLTLAGNINDATFAVSGTVRVERGTVEIDELTFGKRLGAKLSIRDFDPSSLHADAPEGMITAEGVDIDLATDVDFETLVGLDGKVVIPLRGTFQGEKLGTISITATAKSDELTAKVSARSERGSGAITVVARRHPEATLQIMRAHLSGELTTVAALVPGLTARSARIDATARGRLDKLAVTGKATLVGVRYDTIAAERAVANVDLDRFDLLRATETNHSGGFEATVEAPALGDTAATRLTVSGRFARNASELVVNAELVGAPKVELAKVSARVELGKVITARIRSIEARTEGLSWSGGTGVVKIAGSRVTTPVKISLSGPAAALTVGADVRPNRVQIDADISRFDVYRSRALHGINIAAVITGRADVTLVGSQLTGELSAESRGVAIPGVPRFGGSVSASLTGDRVSVTADGAPLQGNGKVHVALTARRPVDIYDPVAWRRSTTADIIAVEADVTGVDVAQLERYLGTKIDAQGAATVRLRWPYEGANTLGVEVDAERGRYVGISGLRAHVRAKWGKTLAANVTLHQAGDKFAGVDATLAAPLHTVWQAPETLVRKKLGGALSLTNFSLRRIERLEMVRASLGGFVTATAKLGGTPLAPVVEIDDGRAAQVELAGVRIRRLFFSGLYRGDQIKGRVAGTLRRGGKFEAEADFKVPSRDLEVSINARAMKLAALQPFAPADDHPLADIDGSVDITNVRVRVDPSNMRASGRVRLRNGTVLLEGGARAITSINANLILRGNQIRLASLNAKNGNGTIKASGFAQFAGYTPESIDIDAVADDIPYVAGSYLASIDIQSKITGSYKNGRLALVAPVRRGRVDVKDTGVELQSIGDLEDVVFVDAKGRRKRAREAGEAPEKGLAIDIEIDLSRGIRVVTAEVDAVVVGQMTARFVGAEMVSLTGQLRAQRGRVKLFERKYNLIRAEATFDGSLPINPDLDIEINRTFPEATVTARVTGRLSQVLSPSTQSKAIQLTSDADFSEEQILALMLGQSIDDVSQQNTTGSQVGGIGRAIVANEVREILRKAGLDVDVVRFHEDGVEFGKWVRFSLGDLFSRQVLLGYRLRDSGDDSRKNRNEGTLELPVTRSINLEGRVGDRGIGSFDLLWIKRF